ncbi:MAG: DHA2 family efflux MFS transporter permease subunit [Burkholderiales bacterium]
MERAVGAFVLSLAVFMTVLDTTIANVSIPTIAGDLGVSPSQGTWVITSFAVSTAIAVPLTGWLVVRFGQVRLFVTSVLLFSTASWLCGLAPNLETLIVFRVLQGAVAGPMVPLSQSMLLSTFPREKAGLALALWSMTALLAPISGPLLGGWISDNATWPWIFYINVPVGLFSAAVTWQLYRTRDSAKRKVPVDYVGLGLLITWVAALQIMLDKGNELDWFSSPQIVTLACVAAVGFALFLVWELVDNEHPIVDLSLFKSRNFTSGTLAIAVGYAVFFGITVIIPLWLQTIMGYTAFLSGLTVAPIGILSLIIAPILGRNLARLDARKIASAAFLVFALVMFMRARFDLQTDFWSIVLPTVIQGAATVSFFLPLTALLLAGLPPERIPAATGLSNFARFTAGAFGASVSVTLWNDRSALHRAHLVEQVTAYNPHAQSALAALHAQGLSGQQAMGLMDHLIDQQARMLGTIDLFWLSGILFIALMALVWIAKPANISHRAPADAGAH